MTGEVIVIYQTQSMEEGDGNRILWCDDSAVLLFQSQTIADH